MKHILGILLVSMLLSGCHGKRVYFGTSTVLGVDFSSESKGGVIGYKNAQFASVPKKGKSKTKEGESEKHEGFSVVGRSDIDLSVTEVIIDEIFATGAAAVAAVNNGVAGKEKKIVGNSAKHGSLLFAANTSISLVDINFSATNPFQGASFGYKRATATVIPIVEGNLRSVYAKSVVNSKAKASGNPCGTETGGIRFIQSFATGEAAENLAAIKKKELTQANVTKTAEQTETCG